MSGADDGIRTRDPHLGKASNAAPLPAETPIDLGISYWSSSVVLRCFPMSCGQMRTGRIQAVTLSGANRVADWFLDPSTHGVSCSQTS
jgi:hypothetical protein